MSEETLGNQFRDTVAKKTEEVRQARLAHLSRFFNDQAKKLPGALKELIAKAPVGDKVPNNIGAAPIEQSDQGIKLRLEDVLALPGLIAWDEACKKADISFVCKESQENKDKIEVIVNPNKPYDAAWKKRGLFRERQL